MIVPRVIRRHIPNTREMLGGTLFFAVVWGSTVFLLVECLP